MAPREIRQWQDGTKIECIVSRSAPSRALPPEVRSTRQLWTEAGEDDRSGEARRPAEGPQEQDAVLTDGAHHE